jgi:hypothetical protein
VDRRAEGSITGHMEPLNFEQTVNAQAVILAWPSSTLRLCVNGEHRVVRPGDAGKLVSRLEHAHAPDMTFEVTGGRYGAFWAVVTGSEQNRWLERFRPAPTMLLREGASTRRVALWWLEQSLAHDWIVRGNKRIAHTLRAVKKQADPDHMLFPVVGSCLRSGRSRPVPIVVERLGIDAYRPRDVVGHLKEPPPPRDWRTQA